MGDGLGGDERLSHWDLQEDTTQGGHRRRRCRFEVILLWIAREEKDAVWGLQGLALSQRSGGCGGGEAGETDPKWWKSLKPYVWGMCVCVCLGHKQSFGVRRGDWSRRGHWVCRGRGESSYLCTQLGFRPTCCLSHSLRLMEALTLQSINNATWKL